MKPTRVVVAGLPGKMATLITKAIASQEDMVLHFDALGEKYEKVPDSLSGLNLRIIGAPAHEEFLYEQRDKIDLVVDFTHPNAVNGNALMYRNLGIPFVMGTTGGDREKLIKTVEGSGISAVIAANMAAPVVVLQEMIKFAAEKFPNAFEGFTLNIRESHQAAKKDPSGTAISLLPYFASLGIPLEKEQIEMLRDPDLQWQKLKIPGQHLSGHGYHTYTIASRDGTVVLEFKHNVLGRNVYVEGALKAIRFLARNLDVQGKVFSMSDVLG